MNKKNIANLQIRKGFRFGRRAVVLTFKKRQPVTLNEEELKQTVQVLYRSKKVNKETISRVKQWLFTGADKPQKAKKKLTALQEAIQMVWENNDFNAQHLGQILTSLLHIFQALETEARDQLKNLSDKGVVVSSRVALKNKLYLEDLNKTYQIFIDHIPYLPLRPQR